ncbi:MAG TPA: hypothetical protein VG323_04075, partial [Thermoanaerobaculia bacterium]|nr:hypothetical protein [Thermoanaerobaculia bacterium]
MKPAAAVFVVALAVRLLYVSIVPPRTLPDSAEYLTVAKNIVAHATFSLSTSAPYVQTIRRAPAYPLFLIATGGAARAVQCVLDALIAAMICAIAARRASARWAVAAGLLYALHPGAIVFANTILSDSLFAFFLTASIALLLAGDALWLSAGAGVVLALAALTRPVAAGLVIVVAAVLFASRRFAAAGVFCAAMLLAVVPWIVRSSVLGGRFVLITSDLPLKLAMATAGNAPWDLNDEATVWGPYLWKV